MTKRSHLRPPQPLQQPQPTDYMLVCKVLLFTSLATIVIMLGFVVTR